MNFSVLTPSKTQMIARRKITFALKFVSRYVF